MNRQKLAALAAVIVLISAGTAMAAYIILSDVLDYDVTVEVSGDDVRRVKYREFEIIE